MPDELNIPQISTKELKSQVAHEGSTVTLKLTGESDGRSAAALEALIRGLHGEAVRVQAKEVVVDLRDLKFMNSSSFKALVVWLGDVEELAPGAQYKIRFLLDGTKHWQARSLAALSSFAADLVRVEM